jgi:hypothetical protein
MIYSLGVLEEQDIVKKSLRHPPNQEKSNTPPKGTKFDRKKPGQQ